MYRREDIETVLKIKRLLYEEGFTIAGARKHLAGAASEAGSERPSNDRISAPAATGRPSFATSVPFSNSADPSAAQHTHRSGESAQASFLDAGLSDQKADDSDLFDEPPSLEELAQPEPEPPMAADFDAQAPVALEDMQAQFISRHTPFSDEQIPTHELQPAPEGLNVSTRRRITLLRYRQGRQGASPRPPLATPAQAVGLAEEQRMSLLDVREELRAILTLLERE